MILNNKKTILKYSLLPVLGVSVLMGSQPLKAQDDYWHQRVSLFDKLPVTSEDIVFLGNSITDGGEFQELFGKENVLNRGIRSDRISGIMKRIDQVTTGQPKMIFLLIGINDVADSRNTASSIAVKYEELVKTIRMKSPKTRLYVQSVMPINNDFKRYKSLFGREHIIPELNEKIKEISVNNGAAYIDLWPVLADPHTGKMHREFTTDGLHLSGTGYQAWAEAVRSFVEGIDMEAPSDMPVEPPVEEISIPIINRLEK